MSKVLDSKLIDLDEDEATVAKKVVLIGSDLIQNITDAFQTDIQENVQIQK